MPFAAILALVAQYGPTVITLLTKYGPEIWNAIAPLVQQSAKQGTLEQDIASLVETTKSLAPLVGPIQSLGHVANVIGDLAPVDAGNPTPEQDRLARPRGGH